VLEGGRAHDLTPSLTTEEEKELLYGSNDDRRTDRDGDTGMKEEAEKAWKQAEKEAEEATLNVKQAELQEIIWRRKAERKQRMEEQKKLEQAAMLAEQNRLQEEAETEKTAHRRQIEKLEEELRKARSGCEEKGVDPSARAEEMEGERHSHQKKGQIRK
jgi:hypothetical protein